jgi:hypothetical protein
MTEQSVEREFAWDDEIVTDSEFILIEPGDHDFIVEDFERGRYNGNDKPGGLPPCNMATVRLIVETPQGKTTVSHRLYLHSRTEWGISAFFSAIGLKKKGEKLKMDWSKVPGATGRAKFEIRKYDGKEFNEVKSFYPKDSAPASAPSSDSKMSWG